MTHRFVAGSLSLIASAVAQAVVGLAANLVLARLIGPEAFGRFAIIFASTGLILTTLSLRLSYLIFRTPAAEFTVERQELYFAALLAETAAAALLSLAWLVVLDLIDVQSLTLVASQMLLHWTTVNRSFSSARCAISGLRRSRVASRPGASSSRSRRLSPALAVPLFTCASSLPRSR